MTEIKIGVIADTHGRLSSQAIAALDGVSQLIHVGDFDNPKILSEVKTIAPMRAVRGNMDRGDWSDSLPQSEVVTIGEFSLYVIHNLLDLDLNPKAAGFDAVIYAHTHTPEVQHRDGVLYLNPGSASFPRSTPLPSVAILTLNNKKLAAKIIELK
ncbi:MAG: metallophosphatase family protein [Chloroflexota bacterium]